MTRLRLNNLNQINEDNRLDTEVENYQLILMYSKQYVCFYCQNEAKYEQWIKMLSKVCILMNYNEVYTNVKVIGNGTFAKVILFIDILKL